MEEELEKTKQSYQTQISAHEKKAHNNWVSSPENNDGLDGFDPFYPVLSYYLQYVLNI